MDKQIKASSPLVLPAAGFRAPAFSGDLFRRRPHADRLTAYLERLREGAVLALDAPLGEGKSWFARNWAASLREAGHKVVYVDALGQDRVADPFFLVAAEIADAFDDGHDAVRALRAAGAAVMAALLPLGRGAATDAVRPSGAAPAAEDRAAAASGADEACAWIEGKLADHANDKASFQRFRAELAALPADQPKSVVLFIDELDRCRPAYALGLIERLKHLFDVPKMVFVVMIDRGQLQRAIGRAYCLDGAASAAYLGKFVDLFFALPARSGDDAPGNGHLGYHVDQVFSRYDFQDAPDAAVFRTVFAWTAAWFNLSVRDIERAVGLYAFAYPVDRHNYLLPYVIALKIGEPDLYRRLRTDGDPGAHRAALDRLKPLRAGTASARPYHYLSLLMEWHEAHIIGFATNGETLTLRLREYDQGTPEPPSRRGPPDEALREAQGLFQSLAGRLDGMN